MKKLKFKSKQIIEDSDWDAFVRMVYDKPYTFQQQEGCKSRGTFTFNVPLDGKPFDFENDTIVERVNGRQMGVSFKAWLERDSSEPIEDAREDWELDLWWERNFYPSVDMIIEDLHKKGLLKEGEYTINIDW